MGSPPRILLGMAVLVMVLLTTGEGTDAAFSATTGSGGNVFSSGTVSLADNDADGAVLTLANARPGDSDVGCVLVTYTGSLPADVRLYGGSTGGLAPYLELTVERGTQGSAPAADCTGFTPDATDYLGSGPGVVHTGRVDGYPADWAGGIVDPPSGSQTWSNGESHSYRFTVTLVDDPAAQGLTSDASFTWEARS